MTWYYVDGAGQQAGPVDDAALDAMTANGGITAETLVWKEGMANWTPLREVRGGMASSQTPPVAVATGIAEAVCSQCGGMFPVQDTIRVGSARVCANCKPVFVQKMREGVSVEQAGALRYAGFWIRFGAVFLDGIILRIVGTAVNLAFGLGIGLTGPTNPGAGFSLLFIAALFLNMFIAMAYESFMIGKYGATLGKMACKIKVVMPDGSKVGYGRAVGRYFSKIVSGFICAIGYIMAGFDSEKRALHDRMCNTRVVFK